MSAYVYILANRRNGALYTGVTADIAARMMQHRDGKGSKFCAEYGVDSWSTSRRPSPSPMRSRVRRRSRSGAAPERSN